MKSSTRISLSEMKDTTISNECELPHIQFVLDIDDTLAKQFYDANDAELKSSSYIQWFKDNNLLIDALKPHILHPGVIEFMQFLFEIPNARVCFFSSSDKERNHKFVAELLKRSHPNDYNSLLKTVAVYSRPDLVLPENHGSSHFFGIKKKDLHIVLKQGERLENTILIEDDLSYVAVGQEKNVLFTSCHSFFHEAVNWNPDCFYAANHIFYITGLLIAALKKGRNNLASHIYAINPQYSEELTLYSNPGYFMDGLNELRRYNQNLNFYCQDAKAIQKFVTSKLSKNPTHAKMDFMESGRPYKKAKSSTTQNPIPQLPDRVNSLIFDFLSKKDLLNLQTVCSSWHDLRKTKFK